MSKRSEVNPGGGAAEHVAGVKDLMVEILARVPAKPVTRLKLVSKAFCSLISDPQFVQSHAQVNNYPSGMFLYASYLSGQPDFFWLSETKRNQSPLPSLTFLDGVFGDGYKVWIVQSSSGLLLCRHSNNVGTYDISAGLAGNLFICNPTTKQYRMLPRPDNVSPRAPFELYFAFDPSISPHYKLVCVESRNQIEVYSSHNHRWRPLIDFKELNIHTNIERYSNWRYINLNNELFHFDLKSEALVQIRRCRPYPSDLDISTDYHLGHGMINIYVPSILRVSLCNHTEDSSISILEMSQDFSEWVTNYRVNLCHLTSAYPEIVQTRKCVERQGLYSRGQPELVKREDYKFHVFGVVEGLYSQREPVLVLAIPGKIISYNFVKKTVKTLLNLPHFEITEKQNSGITAHQYTVSLSSV